MAGPTFDITKRRETSFVLWIPSDRPAEVEPPQLILGKYDESQSDELKFHELVNEVLSPAAGVTGLWEISCEEVNDKLQRQGRAQSGVYLYWFKIRNTLPDDRGVIDDHLMHVTDPLAYALDYRVVQQPGDQPSSVIWMDLEEHTLLPCDHQGKGAISGPPPAPDNLPGNEQLVIYEIPTSFVRGSTAETKAAQTDIGTFTDMSTLLRESTDDTPLAADRIRGVPYLLALGVNALELTPPADAKPPDKDETGSLQQWGYRTAHYFAPDYQLGYLNKKSTAVQDLCDLVKTCHNHGVRFIADMVLAFGHDPYKHIAFHQFHILPEKEPKNPDSNQSNRPNDEKVPRVDWGGKLWRYIKTTKTYEPEAGEDAEAVCPASSFHLAQIQRWISYYKIDGLRLDSIENVANREFLKRVHGKAHKFFRKQYEDNPNKAAKFLVVGEELGVPKELISSGTLDGYWNEEFLKRLRCVILGQSYQQEDFGATVNMIVDCRALDRGFGPAARAINYITSHDIGGWRKERLCNFLVHNRITGDEERTTRAKLAFAILLTSIGTPMIYAGEEFCEEQDRGSEHPGKQADPLNYNRVQENAWRMNVFNCVSRLVKLRTTNPALWGEDVKMIHWDFQDDRKIMAWIRGGQADPPVVIRVNFSGWKSNSGDKYEIPNGWPTEWHGKQLNWKEMTRGQHGDETRGRDVPPEQANGESMEAWEAKVYVSYVDG